MDSFEERWVWVGITCGQRELGERNITNSLHELATWIEVDFNGCSSVAGRSRTAALARERATLPHRHRSTLHVYYTVLQHNNRYWIERRDGLCSRFSRIINYIYCIKTTSFKNGEYEVKCKCIECFFNLIRNPNEWTVMIESSTLSINFKNLPVYHLN